MMDVQSIEQIYTSWDHIKSLPNYQAEFGVSLFSRVHALSKRAGAKFYKDGVANRHHAKFFTQMMDLIIHMLGPDMDDVLEQLEDLGERHAESFGVSSKDYPIFGEALLDTLEFFLDRHWKTSMQVAWVDLWRIISMTMLDGARDAMARKRQQQQQQQQRLLSEEGPADLTDSSFSDELSVPLNESFHNKNKPLLGGDCHCSASGIVVEASSSARGNNKPPRSTSTPMIMMASSGHGSFSSYLNLRSDDNEGFFCNSTTTATGSDILLPGSSTTSGTSIPSNVDTTTKTNNKGARSKKKFIDLLSRSDHGPRRSCSKPSSWRSSNTTSSSGTNDDEDDGCFLDLVGTSAKSIKKKKQSSNKQEALLSGSDHGPRRASRKPSSSSFCTTTSSTSGGDDGAGSLAFGDEDEPASKTKLSSSFRMVVKRPGILSLAARPQSCRLLDCCTSNTETRTVVANGKPSPGAVAAKSPRMGGMGRKMASFRFGKRGTAAATAATRDE